MSDFRKSLRGLWHSQTSYSSHTDKEIWKMWSSILTFKNLQLCKRRRRRGRKIFFNNSIDCRIILLTVPSSKKKGKKLLDIFKRHHRDRYTFFKFDHWNGESKMADCATHSFFLEKHSPEGAFIPMTLLLIWQPMKIF